MKNKLIPFLFLFTFFFFYSCNNEEPLGDVPLVEHSKEATLENLEMDLKAFNLKYLHKVTKEEQYGRYYGEIVDRMNEFDIERYPTPLMSEIQVNAWLPGAAGFAYGFTHQEMVEDEGIFIAVEAGKIPWKKIIQVAIKIIDILLDIFTNEMPINDYGVDLIDTRQPVIDGWVDFGYDYFDHGAGNIRYEYGRIMNDIVFKAYEQNGDELLNGLNLWSLAQLYAEQPYGYDFEAAGYDISHMENMGEEIGALVESGHSVQNMCDFLAYNGVPAIEILSAYWTVVDQLPVSYAIEYSREVFNLILEYGLAEYEAKLLLGTISVTANNLVLWNPIIPDPMGTHWFVVYTGGGWYQCERERLYVAIASGECEFWGIPKTVDGQLTEIFFYPSYNDYIPLFANPYETLSSSESGGMYIADRTIELGNGLFIPEGHHPIFHSEVNGLTFIHFEH